MAKDYFYTDRARSDKIYVFRNDEFVNQLMKIGNKYYWLSLNQCGNNWNDTDGGYTSVRAAIEDIIDRVFNSFDVYQLDTLEELVEFIKETTNE